MAKLAICGGKKVVNKTLCKDWPERGLPEIKAVTEVAKSGVWWRGGHSDERPSKVFLFENAWAKYQNAKHCVALTNGTQAIECALKAAGIGRGDEVLVPALTFVASATAIALVNATPVFVDVDPKTFNIDPKAMEAAITRKTRGAVVVHNGGYPCDMDRIMRIAKKRKITIVEDCAHAHASQWKGKGVGAIGDLGTFSFQMGKTLTCGEGGAVITDNEELAEKAFSFHHIGRMKDRPFYEFHRVASNLRMTEWQGAILLAQLKRLTKQTAIRERNTKFLAKGMEKIDGVDAIKRDKRVTRWGFYYWNFLYDQKKFDGIHRDLFIRAMNAEGVPVGVGAHGRPIYDNPVFENMKLKKPKCPVAEHLHANVALSISHRYFLGPVSDMKLILKAMQKVRANTDELKRMAK
ncbi:MAG: DegT/DnrJ/EryC1/StrS family aminotransferase [Planctomycetes bacterium]|nr:DegT/DnrJ/EryC1/StrS family aminotransferase [Planctomycetota bacterium]